MKFNKTVLDLNEGWCNNTPNLTKLSISPHNQHFIYSDNKIFQKATNMLNMNMRMRMKNMTTIMMNMMCLLLLIMTLILF